MCSQLLATYIIVREGLEERGAPTRATTVCALSSPLHPHPRHHRCNPHLRQQQCRISFASDGNEEDDAAEDGGDDDEYMYVCRCVGVCVFVDVYHHQSVASACSRAPPRHGGGLQRPGSRWSFSRVA